MLRFFLFYIKNYQQIPEIFCVVLSHVQSKNHSLESLYFYFYFFIFFFLFYNLYIFNTLHLFVANFLHMFHRHNAITYRYSCEFKLLYDQ